jgi:regulatory protein YycI of two-component signal transduction system YycFG
VRTVKTKKVLLILVCLLVIAVASIFFISDDKKQITREIENKLNYKNITHVEVFDDKKSVVFIKNDDGTEKG